MKHLFVLIFFLVFVNIACKKNDDICSASVVIITNSAPGCGGWGIVVNGVKYPSANIPSGFQQAGIFVCTEYELYEDMRLCGCCGGTWANIKSMKYVAD